MRGRRSDNWNVSLPPFQNWVADREQALAPALLLRQPSVRTLAALVLLDHEERALSYVELLQAIREKKILSAPKGEKVEIPVLTLRVAVSDLARALKKNKHRYQIRILKEGREAKFMLTSALGGSTDRDPYFSLHREPTEINEPRSIARQLVRYGGNLPFGSLYATYRAAAWWLSESTFTGMKKKDYEADAVDKLQLRALLDGDQVFLVGLATGEGLGEVEILERLLRPAGGRRRVRVHYLAVDSSDILLLSHSKLIAERFADEIRAGDLSFHPVVGDLYRLPVHVSDFYSRGENRRLRRAPALVTYFGNCIGNDENREWDFFQCVQNAFDPKQTVITLVGASLLRYGGRSKSPLEEKYSESPIWLETPRHLMYDLQLLRSRDKQGDLVPGAENLEFHHTARKTPGPYVPSRDYETPHGVKGKVYRVHYTLKNLMETADGKQRIGAGEKLLLYSIVKYDLESLQAMLKARGLEVRGPTKSYDTLIIKEGEQAFHYAVFAAIRTAT